MDPAAPPHAGAGVAVGPALAGPGIPGVVPDAHVPMVDDPPAAPGGGVAAPGPHGAGWPPGPPEPAPHAAAAAGAPPHGAGSAPKAPKVSGPPRLSAGYLPAPTLGGLTPLGSEKVGLVIKAAFGRMIRLAGTLRQAQAAVGETASRPVTLPEAPRQVKSDHDTLATWTAMHKAILDLERKAALTAAQADATKADKAFGELLQRTCDTLRTTILEMLTPPPGSGIPHSALVESLLLPLGPDRLSALHREGMDPAVGRWSEVLDPAKWCDVTLPAYMESLRGAIATAAVSRDIEDHFSRVAAKACKPSVPAPQGSPEHMAARVVANIAGASAPKKKRRLSPEGAGEEERKGGDAPAPRAAPPAERQAAKPADAKALKGKSPRASSARGRRSPTPRKHAKDKRSDVAPRPDPKAGRNASRGRRAGTRDEERTSEQRGRGSKRGSTGRSRKPKGSGERA